MTKKRILSIATSAGTFLGLRSLLQSLGKVLVRIDGPSVNTEATLQVSSFGGEFQEFRVRLPRGGWARNDKVLERPTRNALIFDLAPSGPAADQADARTAPRNN